LNYDFPQAYYKKLTSKKLSADVVRSLQICEKELDLFNITLVRKQVDLRIEKEGKQKAADAQKGGWFSGWFGGEAQAPSADSTMGDIAARVGEALTPEEKAKLYDAIDYSENALPLDYPETYEEFDFNFRLDKLILTIQDVFRKETKGQKILNVEIRSVETK
jgi:vacuolar protein sorting-associated protein 13A/C